MAACSRGDLGEGEGITEGWRVRVLVTEGGWQGIAEYQSGVRGGWIDDRMKG